MKSYYSAKKEERMSLQECLELGRRCSEGDPEAREVLILSHMYLIDSILPSFRNKGVDDDDLFQEGCYGLLKAVSLYDYKRGFFFSTYAVHWIRKQMRFALRSQNVNQSVILKDAEFCLLIKIRFTTAQWMQKYNRTPTCEELADELNISTKKIKELLRFSEPFIDIDVLAPTSNPSAEEEYFDSFLLLDDVSLTDREKTVLFRHLGCNNFNREESLKKIAASMNLSYETIRLDYQSALNKAKQKFLKNVKDI